MAEELKACRHGRNFCLECHYDPASPGKTLPQMYEELLAENAALRAQLPSQGGEAVAVVARIIESPSAIFPAVELTQSGVNIWGTHDLMTVAQHNRILAAATHPADPGAAAVRRELLERVCQAADECRDNPMALFNAVEELRALLAKSEGVKK